MEAENKTVTNLHELALRSEPDALGQNAANLEMQKCFNQIKSGAKR